MSWRKHWRASGSDKLWSASVATQISNGIELNSPQYTPAANAPWLPRLSQLLEPHDGKHRAPDGKIYGLGTGL